MWKLNFGQTLCVKNTRRIVVYAAITVSYHGIKKKNDTKKGWSYIKTALYATESNMCEIRQGKQAYFYWGKNNFFSLLCGKMQFYWLTILKSIKIYNECGKYLFHVVPDFVCAFLSNFLSRFLVFSFKLKPSAAVEFEFNPCQQQHHRKRTFAIKLLNPEKLFLCESGWHNTSWFYRDHHYGQFLICKVIFLLLISF